MKFIIDANRSDEELNRLVSAAEAQITGHRKAVAQLEQIRDSARLQLLNREIQEGERE
ncbi:hypothetical protein [Paraburkholderia sediminicola]|uniref:hypothetical protein n=1 Tax=Paraburkholderia sediminicola TaxID=458836 RepID=UPI0038BC9DF3